MMRAFPIQDCPRSSAEEQRSSNPKVAGSTPAVDAIDMYELGGSALALCIMFATALAFYVVTP